MVDMNLSAILTRAEEGGYVALNPETRTTSQGETVETAIANIREATIFHLKEFPLEASRPCLATTFSVPDPA